MLWRRRRPPSIAIDLIVSFMIFFDDLINGVLLKAEDTA
jgi:hypothetical protein